MVITNLQVVADEVGFSAIIMVLAHRQRWSEALELMTEMREQELKPEQPVEWAQQSGWAEFVQKSHMARADLSLQLGCVKVALLLRKQPSDRTESEAAKQSLEKGSAFPAKRGTPLENRWTSLRLRCESTFK
eukprot:Skav211313  [mRNA]  locus=scaffold3605:70791:71350:+ [translate_table: standard]